VSNDKEVVETMWTKTGAI